MLYFKRDFQSAVNAVQQGLALDPGFARGHYVLGRIYEAQGRIDQAIRATDRAIALAAGPGTSWRAQAIRLRALSGRHDDARRRLGQLEGELEARDIRLSPEFFALVHLAMGDHDTALTLMERAAADRDPSLLWLRADPRVDPLRGNPRFEALLQRLGGPQ